MRTTLSLDDDVAIELQRLQRKRSEPFKQTVNAVLRAGLATLVGRQRRQRTPPVRTAMPPRISSFTTAGRAAAAVGSTFTSLMILVTLA